MKPSPSLLILLFTTLLMHSSIGKTATPGQHSHAAIVTAVKHFLENHKDIQQYAEKDIQVGHLDARLNLGQCANALETYLAPGARTLGKTTVGVRCRAPKPWALYVPARVTLYETVYRTADNLPRGHLINEADIEPVKQDLGRLHRGYFIDKDQLIGKETRRRLRQGHIITPNQVKPPLLVKRGDQVELIAKSRLYAVRMSGKAMADGARGDRIRVKNLSSKRVVEGTVTRAGQVTVMN